MKLSVPTSFRTFGCAWVLLFFVALQASAQSKDEFAVTVRPGDTLISLGKRHLEQPDRWPELRQSNQIRNDRRLKPGDDALFLIVAGDIRENVKSALGDLLDRIKSEAVAKREIFA